MNRSEFEKWSARATKWSADYINTLEQRPVRAQCQPGDIAKRIASAPPESGESMESILDDFEDIIPDGMTHWQHPRCSMHVVANLSGCYRT